MAHHLPGQRQRIKEYDLIDLLWKYILEFYGRERTRPSKQM